MRAAIYARYRSELQRDASIEDQVRLCRARIDTEKWTPAGVYTDHAMSGAIRMRPGYRKLLEDARAGSFDVVVSEALDRLSRPGGRRRAIQAPLLLRREAIHHRRR